MPGRPLVIAHRGIHGTGLTENTMSAFTAAADAGADMIELDVRRSGAGELAILHDHAVGRVALDSCSLDEFENQTGLRPPSLSDVLQWAAGRIGLDVELKEDGYVEQLAPPLLDYAAAGGELIVTSFSDSVLAQLHRLAPTLELGLLLAWTPHGFTGRARACGAGMALPEMKLVDERLIAEAQGAGLQLITWDFFATEHAALLQDARVRGVITDDVPGALAARDDAGMASERSIPSQM